MPQPRVDIYNFPHKGLRNQLSQLTFSAGTTDYSNQQSLTELKDRTAELVLNLDLHRHSEEDFLLPALESKVPGSTAANVTEHEETQEDVNQFVAHLDGLTVNSAAADGIRFYTLISNFQTKYSAHMAMEESDMNPLIWANFTDEELMGMHGEIMATLEPKHIISLFKYIVPALNPMERNIIMSGFKANAPREFFDEVAAVIREEMPAESYQQMVASL